MPAKRQRPMKGRLLPRCDLEGGPEDLGTHELRHLEQFRIGTENQYAQLCSSASSERSRAIRCRCRNAMVGDVGKDESRVLMDFGGLRERWWGGEKKKSKGKRRLKFPGASMRSVFGGVEVNWRGPSHVGEDRGVREKEENRQIQSGKERAPLCLWFFSFANELKSEILSVSKRLPNGVRWRGYVYDR